MYDVLSYLVLQDKVAHSHRQMLTTGCFFSILHSSNPNTNDIGHEATFTQTTRSRSVLLLLVLYTLRNRDAFVIIFMRKIVAKIACQITKSFEFSGTGTFTKSSVPGPREGLCPRPHASPYRNSGCTTD